MFFSTDLLSIRGGKLFNIWMLGTSKDREAVIKKRKAQLLHADLRKICQELVKRFPVQGKDNSFSLRMSVILVYGACVNLRVQGEELRKAALLLLSKKAPSNCGTNINLPDETHGGHLLTKAMAEPPVADLDLGAVISLETEIDLQSLDFRARMADITMTEPPTTGLDYDGPDLPILSTNDILTESWRLEDFGDVAAENVNENLKRKGQSLDVTNSPKRTRVDVDQAYDLKLDPLETEPFVVPSEVTMEVEAPTPDQHAAPARPKGPSIPLIEVTPAVNVEKRKRSPTQLDMEKVAMEEVEARNNDGKLETQVEEAPGVDHGLVDPGEGQVVVEPQVNPEEGGEESDEVLQLQPLVPVVKRPRKKGNKTVVKIDIIPQISSTDIKAGLAHYEDLLRSETVTVPEDFSEQRRPRFSLRTAGRSLGMSLMQAFREDLRLACQVGDAVLEWEVEQGGVELDIGVVGEEVQAVESIEEEVGNEVVVAPTENLSEAEIEREKRSFVDASMDVSSQSSKTGEPGYPQAESTRLEGRRDSKKSELGSVVEVEETEGLVLPCAADMDTTPKQPQGETELQQVSRGPVVELEVGHQGPPVSELQRVDLEPTGQEPHVTNTELQQELEQEGIQVQGLVDDAPLMEEAGQVGVAVEEILPEVGLDDVRTALNRLTANIEERQVMFSSLCPPDSTLRSVAALTFLRVLQMEKNGEVKTVQEEQFQDILVQCPRGK